MKTPSSNIHSIGPLYADDLHNKSNKLYSKIEIDTISDRLNIKCFDCFFWVENTIQIKWIGTLNVLRVKSCNQNNPYALNKLREIGFIEVF